MQMSRRQFLVAGAAAALAGCSRPAASRYDRPGPMWPAVTPRPSVSGQATVVSPLSPTASGPAVGIAGSTTLAGVLPRSAWTSQGPAARNLNPMGRVSRMTVHHEGWKPVWFADQRSTAERLDLIRESHRGRGWADIGYHYIIDRAGMVWEGRDIRYQGAHVRNQNEENLAIMLLGNFDLQRPSDAQYVKLIDTLRVLRYRHNVPVNRIYTHQELMPTACPGRALQPQMVSLRQGRALA